MSGPQGHPDLMLTLRARGPGLVKMTLLPVVAALDVLAPGHPTSSGGCAMGVAVIALNAVIPGFIRGAALSVYRDLWQRRP